MFLSQRKLLYIGLFCFLKISQHTQHNHLVLAERKTKKEGAGERERERERDKGVRLLWLFFGTQL